MTGIVVPSRRIILPELSTCRKKPVFRPARISRRNSAAQKLKIAWLFDSRTDAVKDSPLYVPWTSEQAISYDTLRGNRGLACNESTTYLGSTTWDNQGKYYLDAPAVLIHAQSPDIDRDDDDIVFARGTPNWWFYPWLMRGSTPGNDGPEFVIRNTGGTYYGARGNKQNVWFGVAVGLVDRPSDTVRMFVDGVQTDSTAISGATISTDSVVLSIAGRTTGDSHTHFNGTIYSAMVFNGLTLAEARSLSVDPYQVFDSGLPEIISSPPAVAGAEFESGPGSLKLAGVTATQEITTNLALEATAGALKTAGVVADQVITANLLADSPPGTLKISGVSGDLVVTENLLLDAAAGALKLGGVVADFEIAGSLEFESSPGALLLQALQADYALSGNQIYDSASGQLILQGSQAEIVIDTRFEASPGALKLTGVAGDQVITDSLFADATPGVMRLLGATGDLDIPICVEATPGQIILTGSFATVQGLEVLVTEARTGGRSRYRRAYPKRRVIIGERLYEVENPLQEAQLLRAYIADQERRKAAAEARGRPEAAKKAQRRVRLTTTRLVKLGDREPEVMADMLKRWDEELLAILAASPWL